MGDMVCHETLMPPPVNIILDEPPIILPREAHMV